jgi:hypothetical protein
LGVNQFETVWMRSYGVSGVFAASSKARQLYINSFEGDGYDYFVILDMDTGRELGRIKTASQISTSSGFTVGYNNDAFMCNDDNVVSRISTSLQPSTVDEPLVNFPLKLGQNFPNSFNPETWIPYQLHQDADVTLSIYDLNGHLIRQLQLGHQPAGYYLDKSKAVYWDGTNQSGEPVASGIYWYMLQAGDFTERKRMLLIK